MVLCGVVCCVVLCGFDCLLTASGPRGMFSHLSMKLGCISVIELLQFTIVPSLWASLGQALFQKACHQDAIKRRKTHNYVGTEIFYGDISGGSKLIKQTLLMLYSF